MQTVTSGISVVIVAFNSDEALAKTLPALRRELRDDDELIVIDNTDDNVGFPAGCNRGAAQATRPILVFLNPDAVPQPGWGEAIRAPSDPSWTAWQALVTEPGGEVVNTAGNELHFTGLSWAGDAGARLTERHAEPREVPVLSGACLAVRADAFRAAGGFAEEFFLYQEDADLSLRLRLRGGRLGIEPRARVEHDYEFDKGPYKWLLLERNRWAVLVRCWPGRLLALSAPALLATELAIWTAALAGGWAPQKARATWEALRWLPRLRGQRREIQRGRTISAGAFASHLTPDLGSAFLAAPARSGVLAVVLRTYWRFVLRFSG